MLPPNRWPTMASPLSQRPGFSGGEDLKIGIPQTSGFPRNDNMGRDHHLESFLWDALLMEKLQFRQVFQYFSRITAESQVPGAQLFGIAFGWCRLLHYRPALNVKNMWLWVKTPVPFRSPHFIATIYGSSSH